jgi:hypothetical protein
VSTGGSKVPFGPIDSGRGQNSSGPLKNDKGRCVSVGKGKGKVPAL